MIPLTLIKIYNRINCINKYYELENENISIYIIFLIYLVS